MMSKSFKLVDPTEPSMSHAESAKTNWQLCIICQKDTDEALQNPSQSTHPNKLTGYKSFAENLIRFQELDELPRHIQLKRLDEGQGIISTMIAQKAKWHKTCKLQFNNTMLTRAEKRKSGASGTKEVPQKCTRSHLSMSEASEYFCVFCEQPAGEIGELHEASTFELDRHGVQPSLKTQNYLAN